MLFKDLLRPPLSLIASFRVPYKVIICADCEAGFKSPQNSGGLREIIS